MNWNRLMRCVAVEWKLKLLAGTAITVAFWGGYFMLERVSLRPVTAMPALAFDRMIPFEPGAAFFYVSQFLTMPAIMWLIGSRRDLMACFQSLALIIGVSFLAYFLWPTSIARPESLSGRYFFYDLVASHDLPRNACPSLHAAFGMFVAGCAREVFRGWKNSRWLIGAVWSWTALVLVSTLLIKQHVLLDLVAGGLLGAASWWVVRPRYKEEAAWL